MLDALIERKRRELADLEKALEIKRLVLQELLAERNGEADQQQPKVAKVPLSDRPLAEIVKQEYPLPKQVRLVLKHENRPMRVAEIADALEAIGIRTVSPKGLRPNVASALHRRTDLFESVDRGLWRALVKGT